MNDKPVFILGSERSGSNLLRKLLGNHRDLSAPVSPHFLDAFAPLVPYYGNVQANMSELLNDMISYTNHHYTNWNLKSSAEEIIRDYKPTGFMSAFDALYTAKAKQDQKKYYVSKDNHVFNHMDLINGYYGDKFKFIYLYRDLRDHTASWMKTPLFLMTPYQVAVKWRDEQRKCLQIFDNYKNQVFKMKYEDLVSDGEKTMKAAIEFLGLEWDESCAQTKKENAPEAKGNIFWKNLEKPIIKDNYDKYKKELTGREIRIIEGVAKNELLKLNYKLESDGNFKRHPRIQKIEENMRAKKTYKMSQRLLNEEMKELKSKLEMLDKIKSTRIKSYPYYF